jgi:hypothetical protein
VELKKSAIKSVTCSLKQYVQNLWRNQAFRWAKTVETGSKQSGIDGKWSSEEQTSDENVQNRAESCSNLFTYPECDSGTEFRQTRDEFKRRSVHESSFGTNVSKNFHTRMKRAGRWCVFRLEYGIAEQRYVRNYQ